MAHQYIEKYSNIISAQEMQIKVTITHHYPTHRMATHSLEVLIRKWNNWNSSSTTSGCPCSEGSLGGDETSMPVGPRCSHTASELELRDPGNLRLSCPASHLALHWVLQTGFSEKRRPGLCLQGGHHCS